MRFDVCANAYDSYAAPQRTFAERVGEFIGSLRAETILELGAGTGALTRHLCGRTGAMVEATDASPAMVRLGRKAVPEARWSELDAFKEVVPAADLQVSSGLLHWAPEPVAILRNWKCGLGPGGRMVHAFACEPCLAAWRKSAPESPVLWRDEPAWRGIFVKAGLRVIRSHFWEEAFEFPTALDLVRTMHRSGVTGHARLGPGKLRQAMRHYEARHRTANGVAATWAWLVLEAV